MEFNFPGVLNEMPSMNEFKNLGYDGFKRKVAKKIAEKLFAKTRLAEAQNWKCCYCGCEMNTDHNSRKQATIEHVTPKSKGGTDDWDNLVIACCSMQ